MSTLQTQIDNLSTLIADMQANKYVKGKEKLVSRTYEDFWDDEEDRYVEGMWDEANQKLVRRTVDTGDPIRDEYNFCCLGCMAWQLGARPDKDEDGQLRLITEGDSILMEETYPPLFVADAFGLNARHYDGNSYSGHIAYFNSNGEVDEELSNAYGRLARLNDDTNTFGERVIPELLITLGVLQARRAFEQAHEE